MSENVIWFFETGLLYTDPRPQTLRRKGNKLCRKMMCAFYDKLMQTKHDDGGEGYDTREFGYNDRSTGVPVPIDVATQTVQEHWHMGYWEHHFNWPWSPFDENQIVVGWKIQANWADFTDGTWTADPMIAKSSGSVYVKSQFERGYDWTLQVFFVYKKYFPWLNSGN